jgi:membrane-bound serine protease (ClpP class)
VLLVLSILLAVFVLPSPWGLVAVAVGATLEMAETGAFLWWSSRRKSSVGVQMLVGRKGVSVSDLGPDGQVRVAGEIWKARCEAGCAVGTAIVVRAIDGLTLEVEPA